MTGEHPPDLCGIPNGTNQDKVEQMSERICWDENLKTLAFRIGSMGKSLKVFGHAVQIGGHRIWMPKRFIGKLLNYLYDGKFLVKMEVEKEGVLQAKYHRDL